MSKGFWAVLDQGLFAGSNFVMNVLLARWLEPTEYGAFSLAFAIFLFVGCIHTALLTEPMLVFAPSHYKDRPGEYLGTLIYGHFGFAVIGSVGLSLAAAVLYFFGSADLAAVLLALAASSPFILFLWLMRRACYGQFRPRLAAAGGGIYLVLMVAGAYFIYRFELLSPATALSVMALSSLLVAFWLARRLGMKLPAIFGELSKESLSRHWGYGRWSIANRMLNWVPVNIYYLIIPAIVGLAAGASFKALMNLTMPMLQTVSALTVILLPMLVRAREKSKFSESIRTALLPLLGISILYWLFLGVFHEQIVRLAYDGRYLEYASYLWILGLLPVTSVLMEVFSQGMRALEMPDKLFGAYAVYAVLGTAIGVGFIYIWGFEGSVTGAMLSRVLGVCIIVIAFRMFTRDILAGRRAISKGTRDEESP